MKLNVTSDTKEYEVKINADCLCDMCQEYYTEDEMMNMHGLDQSVCEGCYDHFN